jgi:hypothetical protein
MGCVTQYGVRVSKRQPSTAQIVSPERDVVTGRYRRELDRDAKQRRTESDQPTHRRLPRHRPRGLRPWHVVVAGAAVATAAGGALAVASGGDSQPAATALDTAATATDAPATVAPSSTSPVTPPPTPAPAAVAAETVAGEYRFAMTIVDGNSSSPVGTTRDAVVTFVADCAGGTCTLSSPQFQGAPWSLEGAQLSASFAVPEACPNDPSRSVETLYDLSLRVAARDARGLPTALTGTQRQETPGAAACGGATINDPITWEIESTRIS